jgi:hypothetical protein
MVWSPRKQFAGRDPELRDSARQRHRRDPSPRIAVEITQRRNRPDRGDPPPARSRPSLKIASSGSRLRRLGSVRNGSRCPASLNLRSPDSDGRRAMPRHNELASRSPRSGGEGQVRRTHRITDLKGASFCTHSDTNPAESLPGRRNLPGRSAHRQGFECPSGKGVAMGQGTHSAPMAPKHSEDSDQ